MSPTLSSGLRAASTLGVAVVTLACSTPVPRGAPGQAADALARRMLASVNSVAWQGTGAVRWTFAGKHRHLWDRQRRYAEVRWGEQRALLDVDRRCGVAWHGDRPLAAEDLSAALSDAHGKWTNDAFWLNAVAKAFDPGTVREVLTPQQTRELGAPAEAVGEGLLVRYTSGGRTPGDVYLWHLDANARPVAWQMWVSIIPIGGVMASWEGWRQLHTGAWVSTAHRTKVFDLELSDVAGAATLDALTASPDPFVPLAACGAGCAPCGRF